MRVLVTAGPTREPLDAVRYLSNRSSGALGRAVAEAAAAAGHGVTLLLTAPPIAADSPLPGVTVHRFGSVADLEALLGTHWPAHDLLVMAAAVGDYRPDPAQPLPAKRPREAAGLTLNLVPTPDLVAGCAARRRADQRIVAFALEDPATLDARAAEKLRAKRVDAIVANPLATMEAPDIDATVLTADGRRFTPGRRSKASFAAWLIDWSTTMFDAPRG
jgi:phosphopantothenoylcysteine decarboxylase / phosphopantothenate---cysteine ligase